MIITKLALKTLLVSAGFLQGQIETMTCIAKWESSFNTLAINMNENNTVDYGLFQINSRWWLDNGANGCSQTREELLTAEGNVACAKFVFDRQGFKAWVAYNTRDECNPSLREDREKTTFDYWDLIKQGIY